MPNDRFRITLPPELVRQIAARGPAGGHERSPIISRDLERYYFLLDRARIRLRELFDRNETAAICEACRHYQPRYGAGESWNIPLLHAQVLEAIEVHDLDRKWDVDGKELVTKLRSLDHLALFALMDAVERFWAQPLETTDPDQVITLDFSKVFADLVPNAILPTGKSARQMADVFDELSEYED